MLPTFLGIGFGRCGTTWISECLREHSQIFMSNKKELSFFSSESQWRKGFQWYEKQFEANVKYLQYGEWSTAYVIEKKAPRRIYQTLPEIKILCCIRNPIEVALSIYKYQMMNYMLTEKMTLEYYIDKYYTEAIERQFYDLYLEEYFERFGKEQIMIIIYEKMAERPKVEFEKVQKYLELDIEYPKLLEKVIYSSRAPKIRKIRSLIYFYLVKRYGKTEALK